MVDKSISATEQSVRMKLRDERAYSGVSDAVAEAETRAVTLAEPLQRSNGGRKMTPSQAVTICDPQNVASMMSWVLAQKMLLLRQ